MIRFSLIALLSALMLGGGSEVLAVDRPVATGPLKVSTANSRYFATPEGRSILLAGSHTWETVQDRILTGGKNLDYDGFLSLCAGYGQNFIRLWHFEQAAWGGATVDPYTIDPVTWERPGPGLALDEQPKFDLDQLNQAFFDRLRERIIRARDRGFYVSVMLFNGWSQKKGEGPGRDPFLTHPFHPENNIQGLGVPFENTPSRTVPKLHSLEVSPKIIAYQEAYVRKTLETVNDLDNVLIEIINEGGEVDWVYHMIDFVKAVEAEMPKQHPVGMTGPRRSNDELWNSRADWVSLANEPLSWVLPGTTVADRLQDYENDPPVADGRKVSILDTDHLWGLGGDAVWVWKSFCRGHNPIFMDPWKPTPGRMSLKDKPWVVALGGVPLKMRRDYPDWAPLRRALGDIVRYSKRIDLNTAEPHGELSSTRYCLADPGRDYLVFAPKGGKITLDLRPAEVEYAAEWFVPSMNMTISNPDPVSGGKYVAFPNKFDGATVLYLHRRKDASPSSGAQINRAVRKN